MEIPEIGIYHPKFGIFTDLDRFLREYRFDQDKPAVGIIFFRDRFFELSKPLVNELVRRFEPRANVIPVFATCDETNPKAFKKFFFRNDKPLINAVMKVQCHRFYGPLGEDPAIMLTLLAKLNCPVFLSTPTYLREIEKWRESREGLMPIEVVVNVIRPELDGCIEPILIGGLLNSGYSEELSLSIDEMAVVPDRCDRAASRVFNWIKLRRKRNSEKKVAFILYDYPPGEDNLGNASYLDVFASVERLLEIMKEEGYTVDMPNKRLRDLFIERNLTNCPQWLSEERFDGVTLSAKAYSERFNGLPENIKGNVIREWGQPPGNVMVRNEEILIPGVALGNVFIGLQPSRGVHENPDKAYHDIEIPPHHQYIAFYRWLEQEFEADAVIHVGTHGTLEFLKGKEVGLSKDCFPDCLIGDLPNIYFYWVTNSSEASIAKRRSYAVLVSHKTPPFTMSGLYEELRELEDLVEEYQEAMLLDPPRAKLVLEQALKKAKELNFRAETIEDLHRELGDIKRSIIPKGLHILGEKFSQEDLIEYITYVLRYDREVKSLHRIIAQTKKLDYEDLLQNPHRTISGKTYAQVLSDVEDQVRSVVSKVLTNPNDASLLHGIQQDYKRDFKDTLEFVAELARNIEKSDEIGNVLKALNGVYLQPNIGGDPIRTPEVFPTGLNLYGFDARLVPSKAAYERGVKIADITLQRYLKAHGTYPKTASVVLWGFETMKTRGETIGQILHYVGVRPVRKRGPWLTELEVIPTQELGRPRVDVVVTICGIFRDTFPNLLVLLDKAFRLVSSLNEPPEVNFVKKHSSDLQKNLEEMGEANAERLSTLRIFGPSSSEYATSVRALIETSNWKEEEELGEAYIDSMKYAYGENMCARVSPELLRNQLSKVEMVLQIRDTNEYEITDLDHYYEFFGGLSKAVEIVRTEKPDMVIADTTKEIVQIDEVERFIERGIRTRLLNPKWIDGMLAHDFHGAQKIADGVEYTLGLAATTNAVDNWIWSSIASRYIFDEEMLNRLLQNNPFATAEMARRLMEADRRGYWDATEEEREKLKSLYLDIERAIEERI